MENYKEEKIHYQIDMVKIGCVECGKEFDTYIIVETGDVDPKICRECEDKLLYNE
jgi:hypothetical protein